jgi:ribosomal-protein-alanine N-acetyltransferase
VQVTLETDRLTLRPRQGSEAAIYRQLWTERDERVPPHRRIDREGRPTVADIAAVIDAERDESELRLLAVYVKDSGELIGYCGLIPRDSGPPDEPELAYELLRAVHGRGYATEAAQAVVSWADEAGYERLWAGVWDWNVASRRVLQKIGFRETADVGAESAYGRSLMTVRTLR